MGIAQLHNETSTRDPNPHTLENGENSQWTSPFVTNIYNISSQTYAKARMLVADNGGKLN